jgi:hypothetical protein
VVLVLLGVEVALEVGEGPLVAGVDLDDVGLGSGRSDPADLPGVSRSDLGRSPALREPSQLAPPAPTSTSRTAATASRIRRAGGTGWVLRSVDRSPAGPRLAVGGVATPVTCGIGDIDGTGSWGLVPASAAVNAAPSSAALAGRCAGSLASADPTTAATAAGTTSGSGGGGRLTWASAVATGVSASNGRLPARVSKATTPRA